MRNASAQAAPRGRRALVPLALAVLLVALATMQYHWTGQLGRAEEERARTSLNRAAAGIAADFDRELGRLFFHFLRPPSVGAESELAREVARWRAQPGSPELLRQLLLAESEGSPHGGLTLRAFDEAADAWRPASWPAEALPLRRQVESGRRGSWVVPAADVPALIVPVWPRGERDRDRDRDRGRRTGSRSADGSREDSPESFKTPELALRSPGPAPAVTSRAPSPSSGSTPTP